ncbi:MAG: hypothetical protein CO183_02215 [Candidatus Zambryskibacteria bacterium CG_4_9_14_3_um_filter_42_9]|uniref:Zinc finger DksA/TraR C4-type domain-containing protein n=1 Tax=Candidatus Zambryskibacteria bacterium CG22_combo_CG10-13_8_21_14_all_42_17 TaxID=1975118 RepID=A0A2H0BFN8_9BACT|nr:MAG: hypothetical protein COX06_01190 [Candidatus Zambryskibacteria bacterium CG22_combo_CG10-13_8_21_14_all_42_17]PJA36695.1 MAG: hypothetical protein CO183_02215 [Candidatus Zambryskibacteria bacterium CG_4_9_14_3_um_filter_42_9]
MAIDYEYFKQKLEAEEKLLEKELGEVGRRNPDNPSDWEATPADKDSSQADENILADNIESYDENVAIVNTLESRYKDVKDTLDKIKNKTYGLCEVCHEEISTERLEANQSARTCRKHME